METWGNPFIKINQPPLFSRELEAIQSCCGSATKAKIWTFKNEGYNKIQQSSVFFLSFDFEYLHILKNNGRKLLLWSWRILRSIGQGILSCHSHNDGTHLSFGVNGTPVSAKILKSSSTAISLKSALQKRNLTRSPLSPLLFIIDAELLQVVNNSAWKWTE
jgi:hypothetical protein